MQPCLDEAISVKHGSHFPWSRKYCNNLATTGLALDMVLDRPQTLVDEPWVAILTCDLEQTGRITPVDHRIFEDSVCKDENIMAQIALRLVNWPVPLFMAHDLTPYLDVQPEPTSICRHGDVGVQDPFAGIQHWRVNQISRMYRSIWTIGGSTCILILLSIIHAREFVLQNFVAKNFKSSPMDADDKTFP